MSAFEDELSIIQSHHRYLLSIDSHEVAAFADNFTDDAVYVSPFGEAQGRPAIEATIRSWHEGGVTAGKRHMGGPVAVTLTGDDTAVARSSYFVVEAADAPGIVASGAYEDQWRKVDGTWKIARRVQTVDPSFKMQG